MSLGEMLSAPGKAQRTMESGPTPPPSGIHCPEEVRSGPKNSGGGGATYSAFTSGHNSRKYPFTNKKPSTHTNQKL